MRDYTEAGQCLDVLTLILRHTRESPIHARTIAELTGLDTRDVSAFFALFMRKGFPVCSGDGFWRAASEAEFKAQIAKERERAAEILRKANEGEKNFHHELTLFEQEGVVYDRIPGNDAGADQNEEGFGA